MQSQLQKPMTSVVKLILLYNYAMLSRRICQEVQDRIKMPTIGGRHLGVYQFTHLLTDIRQRAYPEVDTGTAAS